MPLVRISLLQGPDGFGRKVGAVVYRTMVDTIGVPPNDNFQVITEHSRDTLVFDRSYLGIERSDGFINVQITLSEGRTLEKKRLLYRTLAERLQRELNVRPEDLFISLIEVKKENWSFGHGVASYAPEIPERVAA
jgi:phenylpyruvate tautomerase PptA (4-oxalocrotonate tautomerase family)